MAPQRDEIFKQKVNDMCSAYNIAEVHQFPRNSVMEFQNICNEMVAPFLLRHPVYYMTLHCIMLQHNSTGTPTLQQDDFLPLH